MVRSTLKSGFLQHFVRFWRKWSRFSAFSVMAVCSVGLVSPSALADENGATRPVLAEIQVVTGQGEPKIRLFTSDPIDLSGALAEGPDRLVVTIPPVRDRMAERKKIFETGPIKSYELLGSDTEPTKIEFVLRDFLAPVQVTREPLANGAAYSVTLNLRHVDKREFIRLVKLGKEEKPVFSTPSQVPPKAKSDHKPLIVIDPGHGGIDTGAEGLGGVLEKDIVFAFSKAFAKALESTGAVRAKLTRDSDIFIGLDKRVEIARSMGADYFISIHADTIAATTDVRGMTVYVGSDRASDAEAARLAESENKADLAGGLVATKTEEAIAGILGDLMLRETKTRSAALAHSIIERMTEASALNKNPIRSAAFRVLRAPDFPSVLVELGYMSSPTDIGLLTSEAWMAKAADSLSGAVLEFLSAQKPMPVVATEPLPDQKNLFGTASP